MEESEKKWKQNEREGGEREKGRRVREIGESKRRVDEERISGGMK